MEKIKSYLVNFLLVLFYLLVFKLVFYDSANQEFRDFVNHPTGSNFFKIFLEESNNFILEKDLKDLIWYQNEFKNQLKLNLILTASVGLLLVTLANDNLITSPLASYRFSIEQISKISLNLLPIGAASTATNRLPEFVFMMFDKNLLSPSDLINLKNGELSKNLELNVRELPDEVPVFGKIAQKIKIKISNFLNYYSTKEILKIFSKKKNFNFLNPRKLKLLTFNIYFL